MDIDNKTAHKLSSFFGKIGCIPVGSYGRSSHDESYGDFDVLTFKPLSTVYDAIKDKYDSIEIISYGPKFMSLLLDNKIQVDVWKTEKDNFWESYGRHTIQKDKLIYINKFLKNN